MLVGTHLNSTATIAVIAIIIDSSKEEAFSADHAVYRHHPTHRDENSHAESLTQVIICFLVASR
jgi:hypothetical protein